MNLPPVWLLEEPWALLGGGGKRRRIDAELQPGLNGTFSLPGAGACAVAIGGDVDTVWWGAGRETLPALSAPFEWGAHTLRMWLLPAPGAYADSPRIDDDSPLGFRHQNEDVFFTIRQLGAIARPPPRGSGHEVPSLSDDAQNFIDWQLGSFQELLDLEFAAALERVPASTTDMGCVRRGWEASRAAWFRQGVDEDDPARMALIVHLARDKRLRQVLDQTCRAPRVLLQRYRDKVPIARVDELDAACLRWFARQPGRDVREKAGPTQRILAVQRRQSIDTLENRILCWVLDRCRHLSQRYLAQNASVAASSQRCRDVRRFGAWAKQWRSIEPFVSLSTRLPAPLLPNYSLQQHPRYRVVWNLFQRLLRNQRVEDDAWRWQRQLWKDSAHQLFCAHLTEAVEALVRYQWVSTPYIRTELERGRWLDRLRSPGPFRLPRGSIAITDTAEGQLQQNVSRWLAGLGADLLLQRFDDEQRLRSTTCVWFEQDWNDRSEDPARLERCLHALKTKRRRLQEDHDEQLIMDGLLILTGGTGTPSVGLETMGGDPDEPMLVAMRLPPDIHRHTADTRAGFDLAVDRLAGLS